MWDPFKKALESSTFCVFPWIQQYVGTLGDVKPCCVYKHEYQLGSLKDNTLKDIFNNTNTKKLRLDMLNGIERPECEICNSREKLMVSHRQGFNDKYLRLEKVVNQIKNTNVDGSLDKHELFYMDIRFNNLCNFKCRTCRPHFSTSLIMDHRKVYNITSDVDENNRYQFPGKTATQALEEIRPHFQHLEEIYFAGGEPLIQYEHYQVLQELLNTGKTDLFIRYNTNFSSLTFKDFDVINFWKKFNRVQVGASLDGNYKVAEYWRKGTDWNKIISNRIRMKSEIPEAEFIIHATLSWPNSLNLLDFHKEWVELQYIEINDFDLNIIDGPFQYSLKNLPLWKKNQIEKEFLNHIDWLKNISNSERIQYKFEQAIDFMYNGENQLDQFPIKEFVDVNSKFDAIRNENFFDVFTEHNDMKEYFKENGYIYKPEQYKGI